MVKQTKNLKYPEGLVEIPEDASPKTKKCFRQHNYEVRMKEKKATAVLLAKMLQDLVEPLEKEPDNTKKTIDKHVNNIIQKIDARTNGKQKPVQNAKISQNGP